MTARQKSVETVLTEADRLDQIARNHNVVAAEYAARSRFFADRGEYWRQRADDLRAETGVTS